ncbi:unnamed protein product, partial [Didymodactylos carnosus]
KSAQKVLDELREIGSVDDVRRELLQ